MAGPTSTLQGRVAVVTGGTSGIGLEVVRALAARGAQTVVVGRGDARARGVAEQVRATTGNPQVEGIGVEDLASRAGWTSVAEELLRRFPAIHVLVNNAGAIYFRRELTEDGIERTLALNVLAPLALASLLQARLRASAPARVVNVSSAAHEGSRVDLDDLQGVHHYSGFQAYGRSKLELILLSRELALRFAGSGVTVNSVHPGFIRSRWALNNRGAAAGTVRVLAFLFGRSPTAGARLPVHVAADSDVTHVSGEYFSRGHVAMGSAASRDLAVARRLYTECCALAEVPEIPLPSALRAPGT
jgi:NAD(P)-dependent dehydrogenase (short-subunit alcohol dehydrogenase family)